MKLAGILLFSLLIGVPAQAFSKGGGGADYERPRLWFPSMAGDPAAMQDIDVCISISDDFGLDEAAGRASVVTSVTIWADYVAGLRKMNTYPFGDPDYVDVRFKLLPSCNGTEDLTIYFGSKTAEVRAVAEGYAEPLAFAHKTDDTSSKGYSGWGKGFIYVDSAKEIGTYTDSPDFDWSKQGDILISLLVHELGHVLGCGHTPGMIMDGDLAHQLFDTRYVHPPMVDQDHQLFVCDDHCAQDYTATYEEFNGKGWDSSDDPFLLMVGRKSKGRRYAKFHFGVNEKTNRSQSYLPEGYLEYSDDLGRYRYPVKFTAITNLNDDETWLFGNMNQNRGGSYIGRIKTTRGKNITVNINRNNGLMNIFELAAILPGHDYGVQLMNVESPFKNLQYFGHP